VSGGTSPVNLVFDTDASGGNAAITVTAGAAGTHLLGQGGTWGTIVLNDNLVIDHNGSGGFGIARPIDDGANSYSVTKNGTGQLNIAPSRDDTYSYDGGFVMNAGTVNVSNATGFGTAAVTFNGGTITSGVDGINIGNQVLVEATANAKTLRHDSAEQTVTFSGNFTINDLDAGDFTIDVTSSGNLILGGILSGSGGFEKTGAGTGLLRLTNANTFTGPTSVTAGTLALGANASISSSSVISVASGATFDVSAVTGGFALGSAQTLGGSGTVTGAVSLTSTGSILSPGASPGILSFDTNQAWNAFSYEWEVNDWTGTTAGTAFDQIAITGSLDLSSGTAYQLDLLSLDAGNASGQVPNFAETARSWTILTTTTGITGFNASLWTIGTSGFSSSPTATGTFSLATGNGGQDLVLTYVPVPEPAAVGLLGVAGLCAGFGLARQRRFLGRR